MALLLRRSTKLILVLLGAIGCGLGGLYLSVRHEPKFYRAARIADHETAARESDDLLAHATALASDVNRTGTWQGLFTEQQINGWLAVDLPKNHGDAMPTDVSDPRVSLRDGELTIGFRYNGGPVPVVVSFDVEPYLVESNVLAVRVRGARAGLLPLPLQQWLEDMSQQIQEADLHLHWQHEQDDPVAIISADPAMSGRETVYRLDVLELTDGELFVSGTTNQPGVAQQFGTNSNRHE